MALLVTTAHFKNAVERHISYYEAQQAHYPAAGARLLQFLDALEHRVMPMLAANPQLGRPVLLDLSQAAQDTALFQAISQLQTALGHSAVCGAVFSKPRRGVFGIHETRKARDLLLIF
jgi:hypothetical protein